MKKTLFLTVISLVCFTFSTYSQISSQGTMFYFTYIQNRIDSNGAVTNCSHSEVKVAYYIANNTNLTASVDINFSGNDINYEIDGTIVITPTGSNLHNISLLPKELKRIEVIPTNTVSYYNLCSYSTVTVDDVRDVQLMNNGEIQNKVYSVESINSVPIVVYAESYQTMSRDMSMILPIESLGKEYYVLSHRPAPLESPVQSTVNNTGGPSEIGIVSIMDNTELFFILPPNIDSTMTAWSNVDNSNDTNIIGGVVHSVILNKGESYQIQSDIFDLTGTHLFSSNEFAVFGGNMGVDIESNTGTRDYIYEQILPVDKAGIKFIIPQLNNGASDVIKIIGLVNNTSVYKDGIFLDSINKGESISFVSSSQVVLIESSKGINVAQYGVSSIYDGNYYKRDPFFICLSSLYLPVSDVVFVVPPELPISAPCASNVKNDFINIVAETNNLSNIFIDDYINPATQVSSFSNITTAWTLVPMDNNFSYCVLDISNNSTSISKSYRLYSVDTTKGFNAYIYGIDCVEGYGYSVGVNIYNDSTTNRADIELDNKIIFYPNPTKEFVAINSLFEVTKISIFSITGNLIKEKNISNIKQFNYSVRDLIKGSYIIIIYGKDEKLMSKFIKL